jgi:NAD(P)-dependent dehydrogenase (short-subunit alcohol dehydrogenase family)
MTTGSPDRRTIVVTGSASGIGAAARAYLEERGARVIGVDLRDADVTVDLGSRAGRRDLVEAVRGLAPLGIDGIVANAGVNRPDADTIRINYFGAVATLEGLRPLLRGPAPRAVLVASRAVLQHVADDLVEACLAGDEERAAELADALADEDKQLLYASSKRAVARWMRRAAPGGVLTAMIAHRSPEEHARMLRKYPMPLGGQAAPEELAPVIGWFLSPENTRVTGQLLFVDGGGETLLRGDDIWTSVSPLDRLSGR